MEVGNSDLNPDPFKALVVLGEALEAMAVERVAVVVGLLLGLRARRRW